MFKKYFLFTYIFILIFVSGCGKYFTSQKGTEKMKQITWNIDNLKQIGEYNTIISGSPNVIQTEKGKAVQFDGIKDGLLVENLPLAGAKTFTLEIIFKPESNGPAAQRFLHLQENGSQSRILIETRLPENDKWYLDTYIKTDAGDHTLAEPPVPHPTDNWYNATLIYDGQEMRHYVNGILESSSKLAFIPLNEGKTSIGVRINQVHWFKGVIRQVRFTPYVLEPDHFLKP